MTNIFRLNAVGDVMLGDFPLTLGFGVRSRILTDNGKDLFRNIKHILKNSDVCFGNLETVLSDQGIIEQDIRSFQMRGSPHFAGMLKDAGFNVMSVANNHAMQHGSAAFAETVDIMDDQGILPVGVAEADGRIVPRFIQVKGIKVCFLAYSMRPEKYCPSIFYASADTNAVCEDIRRYKEKCDVVIVSLHWGDEFVQVPSPTQVKDAHSFVDAGAALIIGHHPHVIQGIEKYNNAIIAYSLGNFVFDFWQKKMRETMILHCDLSCNGVEKYDVSTVYIDNDYSPELMTGKQRKYALSRLERLSLRIGKLDLNSESETRRYDMSVKIALLLNKLENRWFFLKSMGRYERWVTVQSLKGFIRARI